MKHDIILILSSILISLLLQLAIVHRINKPKFVTVDVVSLSQEYLQTLSKQPDLSNQDLQQKSKNFLLQLQTLLDNIAIENSVIILTKQAVLSETLTDITDLVKQYL